MEVDSAVVADIANCLNRQVSRPMLDGTFHRKLEARKIFQHREQLENALEKASQQLDKVGYTHLNNVVVLVELSSRWEEASSRETCSYWFSLTGLKKKENKAKPTTKLNPACLVASKPMAWSAGKYSKKKSNEKDDLI